jgi:hypothetical protein
MAAKKVLSRLHELWCCFASAHASPCRLTDPVASESLARGSSRTGKGFPRAEFLT